MHKTCDIFELSDSGNIIVSTDHCLHSTFPNHFTK